MAGLAFKTLGGAGEDVVLIHGFGSDRLSWLGTSPALMPLARVHALDLPGHGDSAMEVEDATPQGLAAAISRTLAAQGIAAAHLVAHSLGGAIALLMAAAAPGRVLSLTLIAPVGLGLGVNRDFLARYPELASAEEAGELLRRLVARPQLINKMTIARVLQQLERPGARPPLRAIAAALARSEAEMRQAAAAVAGLTLPRLVVWGGTDAINPRDEQALAAFGGAQLILPDAGHLPHIEAAPAVNASIAGLLAGPGPGAG